MTIDELIKILENYEVFVDDDYGGSYKSVIAYTPDKKVSRAHTSIGTLKIIDTFEEIQKENQELKQKINTYENPNDLTLMFMYCNEKARDMIEELKKELKEKDDFINKLQATKDRLDKYDYERTNQQKEFIEYLEDYIDALKQQKETVEGLDIGEEHILMILEEVLEKYKGIIGGSNENNSI